MFFASFLSKVSFLAMTEQNFFTAFSRVKELSETFQSGEQTYLESKYSEAQARLDFIDKFWIALGWDVSHERDKNPYQQEVKVEKGVAVSNRLKKADYAFYAAPNFRDVKFYVEAKKPSRNLDNADDYFQTIRYGWSSNTPLAVLTDFEQFLVVDCRYKPNIKTAENFALKKFDYREYADEAKFREIYHLFSRESVIGGSLEDYANSLPKRGRGAKQGKLFAVGVQKSVDESFLDDLDSYRAELARAFKNKNADLDGEALTEAVTRTIDRLVFIRFLEDKLIEPETMMDKFDSWSDFVKTTAKLNAVYNGIVFKPHFIDSPDFKPDDKVFADICGELSDKNTPYYFGNIPAHILGSVYERFLGKIIVATDKRAHVEEKPEVRKAGGVYYTPEYIVRYIVENTVGKLIEGKTPEEIAVMRFADIACGSGSFLLGVYDSLLRYHTTYYNSAGKKGEARTAGCLENADGSFTLSIGQRREILRNNVFGVDVDAQAVEVAQLSLALKLLEDATTATARAFQPKLGEKILPDMTKNIVCGNSLIDWDILDGQLFERNEERKLNPMSYEDKFPEIMRGGGFDAIVGNPPYISVQSGFIEEDSYNYLKHRFQTMERISDFFCLFTEKAINLLKINGSLGYIVPSTLMMNLSFTKLRKLILEKTSISNLAHLGDGVFSNAVVPTCVFVLSKATQQEKSIQISTGNKNPYANNVKHQELEQSIFLNLENCVFNVDSNPQALSVISKLKESSVELTSLVDVKEGVKTGNDKIFLSDKPFEKNSFPLVKGRDIEKYKSNPVLFINYDSANLSRPQKPEHFLVDEKLFARRVGGDLIATYDDKQLFCVHTLYTLRKRIDSNGYSLKYVLGIINSRLMDFYYKQTSMKKGSVFPEVRIYSYNQLPIRAINFSEVSDVTLHNKLVNLVEQMLETKDRKHTARTDRDHKFYEDKCAMLERQINLLVYKIYDLSTEEISLIENAG